MYDLITFKQAVKDVFPCLRNRNFIAWYNGKDYFIQEYVKNGKRKELFGHEFIVDLNKRELKPYII